MFKTICNRIVSMVLVFAIMSQFCVMQLSTHAHAEEVPPHNWTYSAVDNTITASCGEGEEASLVALTLAEGEVEAGQAYAPFDAEELALFRAQTLLEVDEADVVYYSNLADETKTTTDHGAAAEGG